MLTTEEVEATAVLIAARNAASLEKETKYHLWMAANQAQVAARALLDGKMAADDTDEAALTQSLQQYVDTFVDTRTKFAAYQAANEVLWPIQNALEAALTALIPAPPFM